MVHFRHTTARRMAYAMLAVISVAMMSVAPAQAGTVLDRIKASGTVTVAHREASIPFSYVGSDGKPVGYALELCQRIVEAVQKHLAVTALKTQYVMVTSANRIATVADGKADLECGSTTNNAERREKVAFTIPHYIAGARYLVPVESPIQVIRDFRGHTLVSTKGTTPLKEVTRANNEYRIGITVTEAPDHAKAVDMVASGKADGFVMDDVLLYGLVSGRPDPERFKVVGKFLTIEPLAIMLPRDDPEFKQVVDDEMKRLILSREAYAIYDRWFLNPIPPANRSLNLPMNYLLKDFWKYPTDKVPG